MDNMELKKKMRHCCCNFRSPGARKDAKKEKEKYPIMIERVVLDNFISYYIRALSQKHCFLVNVSLWAKPGKHNKQVRDAPDADGVQNHGKI